MFLSRLLIQYKYRQMFSWCCPICWFTAKKKKKMECVVLEFQSQLGKGVTTSVTEILRTQIYGYNFVFLGW